MDSRLRGNDTEGAIFRRAKLVVLDPELAAVFPTDDAVNDALRARLRMTESGQLPQRGSRQDGHKTRKR